MAHARHEAAFFNDRGVRQGLGRGAERGTGPKQLERDFAVETSVPGAVDVTECPAANALQQTQGSPGYGGGIVRTGRRGRIPRRVAVDLRHPLEDFQLPE